MFPGFEAGEDIRELGGAFGRVELVAALQQPGGGGHVEIGPEGDHEDVPFVGAVVGHHPFAGGVDGDDGLLADLDVGVGPCPGSAG